MKKNQKKYYIRRETYEIEEYTEAICLSGDRHIRSYPWYGTNKPAHDIIKLWTPHQYKAAIELLGRIKKVNELLENPRNMVRSEDKELRPIGKLLIERICTENKYKETLKAFARL